MIEGKLIAWPKQYSLFTKRITCDRIEFEQTRVSAWGRPIFEMGEFAGVLPRNFVRLPCLENESNALNVSSTDCAEHSSDLPRESEWETVVVAKTETCHRKNLTAVQVAAVGEPVSNKKMDVIAKGASVAGQECLLSNSVESSGASERFLQMNWILLVEKVWQRLWKSIDLVCWFFWMRVVLIVMPVGMRQYIATKNYQWVMWIGFCIWSWSRVAVAPPKGVCWMK